MAKPYDILVFGDTCVDLILRDKDIVPRFGQVEKFVEQYDLVMGGSCCIFAAQAAKLGLRVAVLGRVGDDVFGQLILDTLQASGVDIRYIAVDKHLETGLTLHLVQDDDRAMLTYPGSLSALRANDILDEHFEIARHLHYGSLYLQTGLLPDWLAILKRAKNAGMTISLDTNWDPQEIWDAGLEQAYYLIDLLMPNERETICLSGARSLQTAIAQLRGRVPLLVVKQGAAGAMCMQQGDAYVQQVETAGAGGDGIGAGDSFDAGFLAGWLNGLPLQECLSIGCQCGRAVAAMIGGEAGQLYRVDVPELNAPKLD